MVRRPIALLGALSAALIAAPAAHAQGVPPAPAPDARIAPGVFAATAAGVDLSGLTAAEATSKLTSVVEPHVQRGLVLGAAGRRFRLKMDDVKLRLDVSHTVAEALATPAPAAGARALVPLALTHSKDAVRAFADKVAGRVRRAPRNARLRITLRKMRVTRARGGHRLDAAAAAKAIDAALDDGAASRVLHQALRKVRAKTNADDIRHENSTVLTVDKAHFKVRLFKNLKYVLSYGVAVGQPAYPTPSGLFHIQSKQVNPTWSVPNSAWAGELQGTTVQGGSAANPLKARWMGVTNGVGFHGTGEDASIGTRASHGCIRMHVANVIALYKRVPVGTPVLIK